MQGFSKAIAPYVEAELERAKEAESHGDAAKAFQNLENAYYVLGQESTSWHVKLHWLLFLGNRKIWLISRYKGRSQSSTSTDLLVDVPQ